MDSYKKKLKHNKNSDTNSVDKDTEVEVELQDEDSQTSTNESVINAYKKAHEESVSVYLITTIKIDKGFYTTYELKRKLDKKPSLLMLDSDFQRKNVWKVKQKRELIESVLMGLPLPIFYFNEDKEGRLIVIDGRQRLNALFEFMAIDENEPNPVKDSGFMLDNLKILSILNGSKFNDLDPLLQSRIEDYQLMAHIIPPTAPESIKFDIFDRVNRAGTQLNKQEIRNALHQGKASKLLSDLSNEKIFEEATEYSFTKDQRMKDRYLLLRFISFYLYFTKNIYKDNKLYEYSGDIDEFLGIVMEHLNHLQEKEIESIYIITLSSLQQVCFYVGENAFRLTETSEGSIVKKYPINMNIFENIMYAMTLLPFCDMDIKKKVKDKFEAMKKSDEFRDSINNHRESEPKVQIRYNMIMKIVGEIL